MENEIVRINDLYKNKSKHSQYQPLPEGLRKYISIDANQKTHYEKERLDYILQNTSLFGHVLDIGGNIGFFSFEALNSGAEHVDYYEGDPEMAEFVELAAKILEVKERIAINSRYYDFSEPEGKYDTIIMLNVIHHLGVDFDNELRAVDAAKDEMARAINRLARHGSEMVFQMGFNWGGHREKCLFENGTKKEMIDFITEVTKDSWEIQHIGIPQKRGKRFAYEEACEENMLRVDEYGEFLNRPLFIMKSKLK